MHLRPYNEQTDFVYIAKWVQDERSHALWCANLLPYPLSMNGLRNYLAGQNIKLFHASTHGISQREKEYDAAYVYVDDYDHPRGFFSVFLR